MEENKITKLTQEKEGEKEVELVKIDFPFKKPIKGIPFFGSDKEIDLNKEKNPKDEKRRKPKEPILMLMRMNGDVDIFEEVLPTKIKVNRQDGKPAEIILSKERMQSFPWGEESIRGFIASEEETTCYPRKPGRDSAYVLQVIEEIIANRKNLEAQKLGQWNKIIQNIVLGVIALIIVIGVVLPMFGVKIWEMAANTTTSQGPGQPAPTQPINKTTAKTIEITKWIGYNTNPNILGV